MNDLRTVLVCTDFSDTATAAFPPARSIAERFGARVVLAYVDTLEMPALLPDYPAHTLRDIVDTHHDRATTRLREIAEESFPGLDVSIEVSAGSPHSEIIRLARERGAGLIVMATHGRGFVSHAILGSTTERVLRRAPCPVLAVRHRSGD